MDSDHQHAEQAHAGGRAGARPFAFASSPRHFERDRPFAIEHIAIDLTLDFEKKSVRGTASLRLRRVDPEARTVVLDAVAFDVSRVSVDGKVAKYTYDGKLLSVELPLSFTTGTVEVAYSATPRKGLYFLEPDEHVPNRPRQVWTQCQEEDGRHFFPCHDKPHVKMTTETRIRVPEGFFVLSNGELHSREKQGDSEVFHWKMNDPHPSYLVTIVAGEFAVFGDRVEVGSDKSKREVPLTYLVPKGHEEEGRRTFARTPEMVTYFSELLGVPYPWNKYAQVVVSDFIFGGMENTTATTMYEHILLDARAALDVTSDDLIAHELAHQWFGDFVTCRDWSEGWLNEGFATFMEHVWRKKLLGQDEYEYGVRNDLASYLGEADGRYKRPVVCQDYDAPLDLFDRHLYEKGGLVLHVLATELGERLFWQGVSNYLHRHARGVVETRDLLRSLEEVSGRSLGRRFEEMLLRPGHPELSVDISWDDGVLTVAAKQTQSNADGVPQAFEIPIVLSIGEGEGKDLTERRERIRLSVRTDTFAIPCKERPRFVVVDPEMRILGDVTVKAPLDMLRAQLEHASTARSRWLAADALAKSDDPVTIAALANRLNDESEFWGVRAECADALGRIRARESFEALSAARTIEHPKVRRAVVAALGRFRSPAAVEALKPIALRDPSYLVEAEAARSLGKTRQHSAFETLLDVIDRPSWADVIAAGAVEGLSSLRDDRALPHLYSRTRYGHPSRVRRAAALAVPKISTDRRAREHLEDLLDDSDPILRIDVVRALTDLGDGRSRPALRARGEIDLDPRVRRRIREALRDLGGDRRPAEQLKEDLERLRDEHAELKARMSKLEARLSPPEKEKGGKDSADAKSTAKAKQKAGHPKKKTTKRTR
ncbi:Aminopeptidase [Labilithrix luteola]|uniref:Aminopeptidase N n=1 Tax=Labilithrix luteola TaxID=1391654 RepID=A0A0K1PLW5_9BACT|nr:Aminopeptidase [Labilithrix luteola]